MQVQQYLDEREAELQAPPPLRAVRAVAEGVAAAGRRALVAMLSFFGLASLAAAVREDGRWRVTPESLEVRPCLLQCKHALFLPSSADIHECVYVRREQPFMVGPAQCLGLHDMSAPV